MSRIIYVDIDDTICYYDKNRFYTEAKPYIERIDKINKLFDDGNVVIYWTARGSTTGIDWTEVTKSQLASWGAKYTSLFMGKPHYDVYIDDKSINSENYFKSDK